MTKKKFYAVRVGYEPGIYGNWEECKRQVEGYPNAVYKSFSLIEDAREYLNGQRTAESVQRPVKDEVSGTIPQTVTEAPRDEASLKHIIIYADGACTGNPGPGGYGVVLLHGDLRKEFSAGFRLTTNNRMEILGCIIGLQALKQRCNVTIYSDSRYVVNAMTKSWALRWRKNGWMRKLDDGSLVPALNADLWAQMLDLCDKHTVRFNWIRGHSGNIENERCDELARNAAASRGLGIDAIYETPPKPQETRQNREAT